MWTTKAYAPRTREHTRKRADSENHHDKRCRLASAPVDFSTHFSIEKFPAQQAVEGTAVRPLLFPGMELSTDSRTPRRPLNTNCSWKNHVPAVWRSLACSLHFRGHDTSNSNSLSLSFSSVLSKLVCLGLGSR